MELPFGRTRALESQVDSFLDVVAQGVLAMHEAVKAYMNGDQRGFCERISRVSDLESQADEVSRGVETALYTYSLLPESRGDVLQVLELTDDLIDLAKAILYRFEVEMPDIPEEFQAGFLELTELSAKAADNVIISVRAYFTDTARVKDTMYKVGFYEREADRAAKQLKTGIFRSDLHLSHKQHLRYFADHVESLSDLAEDVAEFVAIAAIKRSV